MPMHLDVNAAINLSSDANSISPQVAMSWGILQDDTIKLLRNPVWCRDVLMYQLVLAAKEAEYPYYPPELLKPFADYKKLLLVFFPKSSVVKANIINGINLLNKIETELEKDWKKLRRTELVKTDNNSYVVVDGSKFWKSSTLHASFWSLVLRTSFLSGHDITLPWIAQNYLESNAPVRNQDYIIVLNWSDIINYIPKVLKQLKITDVNGGIHPLATNHSSTGIYSNFRFWPLGYGYYTNQCRNILIQLMKAAGDPNEKKIPR